MHLGRAGGCILQNLIAAYHRKCLHIEQHTFISRFRFVSAEADAKVDCSRISLKRVLSLGTRAVADSPSSEPWTHHRISVAPRMLLTARVQQFSAAYADLLIRCCESLSRSRLRRTLAPIKAHWLRSLL